MNYYRSIELRDYFNKHLNPTEQPSSSDVEALEALDNAQFAFDEKLKTSFSKPIKELEELNYPGFSDPKIQLSSRLNLIEGLNHDSAVQFNIFRNNASDTSESLYLPEKYNGLGYQNLISMVLN